MPTHSGVAKSHKTHRNHVGCYEKDDVVSNEKQSVKNGEMEKKRQALDTRMTGYSYSACSTLCIMHTYLTPKRPDFSQKIGAERGKSYKN